MLSFRGATYSVILPESIATEDNLSDLQDFLYKRVEVDKGEDKMVECRISHGYDHPVFGIVGVNSCKTVYSLLINKSSIRSNKNNF